jgi:hypothetical protein
VRVIDLESGHDVSPPRDVGPEGSSCEALCADEEGVVACYGPSYLAGYGPSFFALVSHALSAHPRIERQFEGQPAVSFAAGSLLVGGRCSGEKQPGFVCQRRAGTWIEHDMRKALGAKEVAFWVPKEDGGVAAIFGQFYNPWFVRDPLWFDGVSGALVPLSHAIKRAGGDPPLLRRVNGHRDGPQRTVTEWIVTRDGTLRGFTAASSIAVDARGHESVGPRVMDYVAAIGSRALARDPHYGLWQSPDYGESWKQVEPPPYDPRRSLRPIGQGCFQGSCAIFPMQCSLVGCLVSRLEIGTWLRIGWPEEPLERTQSDRATAKVVTDTVVPPAYTPSPQLPLIECTGQGGQAPKGAQLLSLGTGGDSSTPGTVAREGDAFVAVFGGRRWPVRQAGRSYANVDYRDRFVEGDWPTYELRAVAHYEGPADLYVSTLEEHPISRAGGSRMSSLVQSRKPIDLLFSEDFDPSGRILSAKGSFAQWQPVTDDLFTDGSDGRARPVLSDEPGHAGGVLLIDNALTLWADSRGSIRPVQTTHPRCFYSDGYVDQQGKLFVLCGDTVEAADGSRAVAHAPGVFLGFPEEEPHYKGVGSVPDLEAQSFLNPDAIAVGKDGRVGILRLPSGAEPSTVDDPAWWIPTNAPPVELAPWSTLEVATSAACSRSDDGARAIIQTQFPWVTVAGSSGFGGAPKFPEQPGMKALVRWSKERVCLEAIELGYRGLVEPESWRHRLTDVMLVARFVGRDPGAALLAFNASAAYRETVSCRLRK